MMHVTSDPHTTTRKILFQHIPKTAGTALIEQAEAVLGDRICQARYDSELTDELIKNDQYTLFHGHFSHSTVTRFKRIHPDTFVFTLLRHPCSRVISQYHNWTDRLRVERELDKIAVAQPTNTALAGLRAKFSESIFAMSLDDFLDSEDVDICHVIDNLQAQYLTYDDKPTHRRFQHAVPNALLNYDFIGLQELYAPSLRIIEAKSGLPAGCLGGEVYANTHGGSKPADAYRATSRQIRKIEGRNAYDLALFYTVLVDIYRSYGDMFPPLSDSVENLSGVVEI